MADEYVCGICEKPESKCTCDKFCNLCQGEHNVRMCNDGQLYCLECREACDLQAHD